MNDWSLSELVATADSSDEREWVPAAMAGVWMRPLLFDVTHGAWINVVRMRTEGLVSRHHHPNPVHGFVIRGQWRYIERPWTASAGTFIMNLQATHTH